MEISKTADQALAVLLAIAEQGPVSATQLSKDLKLNRTVVMRHLATLSGRGFVHRQGQDYVPGAALLRAARNVEPVLRTIARPSIAALAESTGETIVLSVQQDLCAAEIDQIVTSQHAVRVEYELGIARPLHLGSSGRSILAYLDEVTRGLALKQVANPEQVEELLQEIRALGYATSHDEVRHGVFGLSAPVLDDSGTALASVSVLAPTSRGQNVMRSLSDLLDATAAITTAMAGERAASSMDV